MNLEILVDFLKEHGAGVDAARNGIELLELFSNCSCGYYDLVLTDNRMPEMSGSEAIPEMRYRSRGDGTRIPIIVISTDDLDDVKLKVEKAGDDCTLRKPYNFTALCT